MSRVSYISLRIDLLLILYLSVNNILIFISLFFKISNSLFGGFITIFIFSVFHMLFKIRNFVLKKKYFDQNNHDHNNHNNLEIIILPNQYLKFSNKYLNWLYTFSYISYPLLVVFIVLFFTIPIPILSNQLTLKNKIMSSPSVLYIIVLIDYLTISTSILILLKILYICSKYPCHRTTNDDIQMRRRQNYALSTIITTSFLQRCPTKTIDVDVDNECVICYQNAEDNTEDFKILPCAHFFHYNCIYTWLMHKKECPICRQSVKLSDGTTTP
jgi:hypothetical protein